MKHFAYNSSYDSQLFGILLSPSWLSGLLAIMASGIVVAFAVISSQYKGSDTRLQLLHLHTQTQASTASIGHALDRSPFISNLPLLLFWCLVGLVVYMFAVNIVGAIQHAAQFNEELATYANINRRVMIRAAIQKLGIRLIVLVVWIPYILFFFKWMAPYVMRLAIIASVELTTFTGIMYLLTAVILLTIGLHFHTILLRLMLLRPRLFGGALYIS